MNVSPSADRRALVLGGGGSTGHAWLVGVVAGLADAGVDVTAADLTIGTSAGSTAAVRLARTPARTLYDDVLAETHELRAGTPVSDQLVRMRAVIAASSDAADMRRRMGAAALELDAASDSSWSDRWRAVVAARLPDPGWPRRPVLVTAVDARNGEPVVFDRDSGVDVVDAVAASTSSRLPYRIGDGLYLDGGYRRNENADLAAGCGRVLVLAPFGGRTMHPLAFGMQLAAQVDELRAAGSRVATVFPAPEHENLFGTNAMDLTLRPDAARAGYDDGTRAASGVRRLWE